VLGELVSPKIVIRGALVVSTIFQRSTAGKAVGGEPGRESGAAETVVTHSRDPKLVDKRQQVVLAQLFQEGSNDIASFPCGNWSSVGLTIGGVWRRTRVVLTGKIAVLA